MEHIRNWFGSTCMRDSAKCVLPRGVITTVAHLAIYENDSDSDTDSDSDSEEQFDLCEELTWNESPCDWFYCFSATKFPNWPQNCTVKFQTISTREKLVLPNFRATFMADKCRKHVATLNFASSYLDIYEVPGCPWKYRDAAFEVIHSTPLKSFDRDGRVALLLEGWYPSDDLVLDKFCSDKPVWREAALPESVPLPGSVHWQTKLRKYAAQTGPWLTLAVGRREWQLTLILLELTTRPLSMFAHRQANHQRLELNVYSASVMDVLIHHLTYGRLPTNIDPELDVVQLIQAADFYQIDSLRAEAATLLLHHLPPTITAESLHELGQIYRLTGLTNAKLEDLELPNALSSITTTSNPSNAPLAKLKEHHHCTHCVQAPWNMVDEDLHYVYFTRKEPRIPVMLYIDPNIPPSPSFSSSSSSSSAPFPSNISRRQLQARLRKARPITEDEYRTMVRKYQQRNIRKYVINESFWQKLG